MSFEISSERLKIKINTKGAELSSILLEGTERLWQANKDVWPRHAPVLFPIVGKLKNDTYLYSGKNYKLSQHGFARDLEFTLVNKTLNKIVFELKNNDSTLKHFPFEFSLQIIYSVENTTIVCTYVVSNLSKHEMYFGIGAHPGFKLPIDKDEQFTDYYLAFENENPFFITKLDNGLLSENKTNLVLNNGKLPLQLSLFDNDALVFENAQINSVSLVSSKTKRGVKLECKNWPYFGIWSKKGCEEFICLEPWHGITDTCNSYGDLVKKKGINKLNSGDKFECSFSMNFF